MAAPSDNDPPRPDDDATQILSGEPDWPVSDLYRVEAEERLPTHDSPDATTAVVVASTPDEPAPERRRFPVDPVPAVLLAIAAALLLIGLAAWLVTRDSGDEDDPATTQTATEPVTTAPETTTLPPAQTDVPEVSGLTLAEARRMLEDAGFRVRIVRHESARPPGEVLRQEPVAGTPLAADAVVVLTVAREAAPRGIAVPNVTGLAVSEATAILRDADLRTQVRLVPSSEPAGRVLEQSPEPGTEVDEDALVMLEVSEARAPTVERVDVPDTIGTNVADARPRLRDLGLRVRVARVVAADAAGTVVGQSPPAGTSAREGATVTLRVSTGPSEIAVPDVTGLDEASARSQLEDAGFEVRVAEEPTADPAQDGLVRAQSPVGGSSAREGTVVTITVARYD